MLKKIISCTKVLFSMLGCLVVVAVPVILMVIFLNSYFTTNEVVKTLNSADGKYVVYAYVRDAGATTEYSTHVSIFHKWRRLGGGTGNVFHGYRSAFIDIEWKDDLTLVIYTDVVDKSNIFLNKESKNGFNIIYTVYEGYPK